jgi:hypothetical protein
MSIKKSGVINKAPSDVSVVLENFNLCHVLKDLQYVDGQRIFNCNIFAASHEKKSPKFCKKISHTTSIT